MTRGRVEASVVGGLRAKLLRSATGSPTGEHRACTTHTDLGIVPMPVAMRDSLGRESEERRAFEFSRARTCCHSSLRARRLELGWASLVAPVSEAGAVPRKYP